MSASAAAGAVQRAPLAGEGITRVGTFSGALRSGGEVVGRFSCRLRISESRRQFAVTAWPEGDWMAVPRRGHWRLLYDVRARGGVLGLAG